ncbi:unnamed protein product (macronuclear) [Paramecium tetraurelia]|uniref:Spindle assembly abnormal protein 6 N-terminal domain-containing protein n=1 Tax=Paramecium tetraurelia TaxID=5888 RepID=A0CFE3_PARTE|nr:uncharacterized protein GSPATT00037949001 [Paramecium tetraurelia]CAK69510.1 unnamed protein product [Paramecium tetraurelia]|eukprot:XP_001436907.1 hypothetical protein (macronuclear) [Paramecium tetraurelia strain d4-2]
MLNETFEVYFKKKGKSQEFQCQFLQLKMQVAKFDNEIPFDCLVLIDQNDQVYSATQQSEQQRKQNLMYTVYDVRDIIIQERIRQKQLLQQNREPTEEILNLKAKLYDQAQQIQKMDKRISQLQGESYYQKAESDKIIQELNNQICSLKEEKQRAESTFQILIAEKIEQFQFVQEQKSYQEREQKNEIERLKKVIGQFEFDIMDQRTNNKEDIQKNKEQYEKKIQQLQEELTQQEHKFLKSNQELIDMKMACEVQIKELSDQSKMLKFAMDVTNEQHQLVKFENQKLNNKVETLTQRLYELQNNNKTNS